MSNSRIIINKLFQNKKLKDSYSNLVDDEEIQTHPTPELRVETPQDRQLHEISQRRDSYDSLETSEEMFFNSQYYSVKEAAKMGCTLTEIRTALGYKNNIANALILRLANDKQIENNSHVKAVKQECLIGNIDVYKEALRTVSELMLSLTVLDDMHKLRLAPKEEDLKAYNASVCKLIENTWLFERKFIENPVTPFQIQRLNSRLEDAVLNLLETYFKIDGKLDDPKLLVAMPIGTGCKLTQRLLEKLESEKPIIDPNTQSALSLFR